MLYFNQKKVNLICDEERIRFNVMEISTLGIPPFQEYSISIYLHAGRGLLPFKMFRLIFIPKYSQFGVSSQNKMARININVIISTQPTDGS